jgi:hypothetical protein
MPDEDEQYNTIEHLHQFETSYGVVRDARRIQPQLVGLIITEGNLPRLRESFDKDSDVRNFQEPFADTWHGVACAGKPEFP